MSSSFLQPIFWRSISYDLVLLFLFLHHLPLSSSSPFFFLFLIGMCKIYPRLINFCSSSAELYPLSRQRCCNLRRLDLSLNLDNGFSLLITALSTTSITSFMSWVLAGDITTDRGIPFFSVKMCLFVPSLLLSVGLFPVLAPLKVT